MWEQLLGRLAVALLAAGSCSSPDRTYHRHVQRQEKLLGGPGRGREIAIFWQSCIRGQASLGWHKAKPSNGMGRGPPGNVF